MLDEPVRFISTVQVGITVFSILLGAIGASYLARYLRRLDAARKWRSSSRS